MKKTITVLITSIAFWMAIKAENVIITGKTNTIPDGAIAYLFQREGPISSSIATDTITDGNFRLSITTDSILKKLEVNIYHDNGFNRWRSIYVRPGAEIEIIGDDDSVQTWEVKSNVAEQAEYDRYVHASKDVFEKLNQLKSTYESLEKSASSEEARKKARDAYKASKPYRDSLDRIAELRDIDIMRKTSVSQVWMDKMEDIVKGLKFEWDDGIDKTMKELFAGINDSVKATKQGIKIGKLLYPDPKIEVGEFFPDDKFYDLNGREHTIQEMRGQWTVVVLWSVGCMGSHYAFQELPKLLKKHNGNLNGILLSIDTDKWWRTSSENYNISGNNWSEGLEDMGLYQRFGAKGLPTVVMVTPEGRIADIFLGFYKDRIEDNLTKKYETLIEKQP